MTFNPTDTASVMNVTGHTPWAQENFGNPLSANTVHAVCASRVSHLLGTFRTAAHFSGPELMGDGLTQNGKGSFGLMSLHSLFCFFF